MKHVITMFFASLLVFVLSGVSQPQENLIDEEAEPAPISITEPRADLEDGTLPSEDQDKLADTPGIDDSGDVSDIEITNQSPTPGPVANSCSAPPNQPCLGCAVSCPANKTAICYSGDAKIRTGAIVDMRCVRPARCSCR